MIFETERLFVRQLIRSDFSAFHEMQGNALVMQYTTGRPNTAEEDKKDLEELIAKYSEEDNEFWVWAVIRTSDEKFIGTVALIVNDLKQDEIGYRFLEKYWGQGYASEVCIGLIEFWKQNSEKPLYAYVDVKNKASIAVLESSDFLLQKEVDNVELQCRERIYIMQ